MTPTVTQACLWDNDSFITPVIQNVKLKSAPLVRGTVMLMGRHVGSNNSALEAGGDSIHSETFTSQTQTNSKNTLEHFQFQTGQN
jgi:hypothetical protein